MFIRYAVEEIHPVSQRPVGVFHALRYLRDDGELLPDEAARADAVFAWFTAHLALPVGFSRKPGGARRAVSWFRDSATEHIRWMREVASILREHGVRVRVLATDRPGYVVYEDEFQVVAEPFADTGA